MIDDEYIGLSGDMFFDPNLISLLILIVDNL